MTRPTVSVLMAVLNVEPFVEQAITSILNQTYGDFEFIIIDDGSSDGTWAIITDYASRAPRIVALRNPQNLGTSRALNKGLAVAQGEYITRQDGDDWSLPERLAKQVAYLTAHPTVGAVGASIHFIDQDDKVMHQQTMPATDAEIQGTLLDFMCFCGPTLLVRRQCLEEVGLCFAEDLSYSEDYDLCLRLAEVTQLANMTEPLYMYRHHAGSVSYQKRHQQMFRKALALERAARRRYGAACPSHLAVIIGRDYLRAAILAFLVGEHGAAKRHWQDAVCYFPMLATHDKLVEEWVEKYMPRHSTAATLAFIESLFVELFPPSRHLAQVQDRLLSKIHMQEVFEALRTGQRESVDEHLWSGIRHDPRWLLNRGVLSQALRRLGTVHWR